MQNMGQYADLWVSRHTPRMVVTTYPLCGSESSPPEAIAALSSGSLGSEVSATTAAPKS